MLFRSRNECREFEKINGLWIPIHYGWIDPSAQYGGDYEVVSVRVNAPNENTNKYFEFPENARVVDKIRGVQYTIKKNKVSNEMSSPVNSVPPITLLPSPATDTQLADTALKAQELMAEEQKRASGTAPLVVPIDIVPAYVWVLPGKNEYVLSISADGPKPSLVKHTFDPDGLVMQGLEDKIASDGKIRVSLERPAEQKAFANGVLTLDFADQTKTVHFVAAPVIIEEKTFPVNLSPTINDLWRSYYTDTPLVTLFRAYAGSNATKSWDYKTQIRENKQKLSTFTIEPIGDYYEIPVPEN